MFPRSRTIHVVTLVFIFVALTAAAQELPVGTILPVMSRSTLNASRAKVGEKLQFRLMQNVTLPSGTAVRAGARLEGQIVEVSAATSTSSARVVIRIDRLTSDKKEIPVRLSLRALASMLSVSEAQLPTGTFAEYGTSVSDWTTVQIGGAAVYLGDATVRDGLQILGRAPAYGVVTAKLIPAPKCGCPARDNDSGREEALWLFSPWACGVYGFEDLAITHHGNTAPVGDIILTAPKNLVIRGGSGWLLQVVPAPEAAVSHTGQ
jgi:hypothetical protein